MDDQQLEALKQRLIREFQSRGLARADAEAEAVDMLRKAVSKVSETGNINDATPGRREQVKMSAKPGLFGVDRDEWQLADFMLKGGNGNLPDRVVANIEERTEEKRATAQEAVDKGGPIATDEEKAAAEQGKQTLGSGSAWEKYLGGTDNRETALLAARALFGYVPDAEDWDVLIDEYALVMGDDPDTFSPGLSPEQSRESYASSVITGFMSGTLSSTEEGQMALSSVTDNQELAVTRFTLGGKQYEVSQITKVRLLGPRRSGLGSDSSRQLADASGESSSMAAALPQNTGMIADVTWETGGWLRDRPDLFQTVIAEATDAGVNPETLAAVLYGQGALKPLEQQSSGARRRNARVRRLMKNGFTREAAESFIAAEDAVAEVSSVADAVKASEEDSAKKESEGPQAGSGSRLGAAAARSSARRDAANRASAPFKKRREAWQQEQVRATQERNRIRSIAQRTRFYQAAYGGPLPAVLAMLGDEGLAGRMRDGTITEEDLPRIDELMKSANYGRELGLEAAEDPMLAERQYQSWRSAWAKYYGVKDPGGAGGADEPPLSYQLPDTGAVRDSLRSYYRGWFRRDPSDMEVNYFKGMLDKAIIDGAQRERQAQLQGGGYTQVNPDSLMEEFVRSSPEYRQLFGNKPGGMSEEEYAGTFESQAQQFLGDVADDDAVRAGMISGSTQTTIGRAAMSGKASESSSFQDRLARAAQMIASMT